MQHRIAHSSARLLMSNPLITVLLVAGGIIVSWYFIISYVIDSQYLNALTILACVIAVYQYLNRAVLPIMKSIKAQREKAM